MPVDPLPVGAGRPPPHPQRPGCNVITVPGATILKNKKFQIFDFQNFEKIKNKRCPSMRSSKNPRDDFAESVSNPSKIAKNIFKFTKRILHFSRCFFAMRFTERILTIFSKICCRIYIFTLNKNLFFG